MKLLIAILVLLSSCALALTPSEKQFVEGIKASLAELKVKHEQSAAYIAEADAKNVELWNQLTVARERNESALAINTKIAAELITVHAGLELADQQVQMLKKYLSDTEKDLADSRKETDLVLGKYHRIKYWVSGALGIVAAALSGLLILRWGGLALNTPIGAGVALGAPVVVFGVVWGAVQLYF